mgnify:FL=1
MKNNFSSRNHSVTSNYSKIVGGNQLPYSLPKQPYKVAQTTDGDLPIPRADPKVNPVVFALEQTTGWIDNSPFDKQSPRQKDKFEYTLN